MEKKGKMGLGKKILVWSNDIYFALLSIFIILIISKNEILIAIDNTIFIIIILLVLIFSVMSILFFDHYREKKKFSKWGVGALMGVLFGGVGFLFIFVPLHYFMKLRPFWTGKMDKIVYG